MNIETMKLFGGRKVLLANVAALFLTCFIIWTDNWVHHDWPPDKIWLQLFVAPAVMFLIRNVTYSYIWLGIHVVLSIPYVTMLWAFLNTGKSVGYSGNNQFLGILVVPPLICLAVYLVFKLFSLSYDWLKRWAR